MSKFKYQDYLKNGEANIKHIILTKKSEFHSKFMNFWDTQISVWLGLPYLVIVFLLYLVYRYSNNTVIEIICFITMFLMIPLAWWLLDNIKSTIEDYIFNELIFPQIEQKYINIKKEDKEE